MSAARLLEIRGLDVTMGAQHIPHGVDLAAPERGVDAALGGNGVGKTTLMRAISGVYRATHGAIRFRGEDLTRFGSHELVARGLAQAPEGRQIFPPMSVRENLLIGGGRHGIADLDRVLSLFPILGERMSQAAGSLSGASSRCCASRAP